MPSIQISADRSIFYRECSSDDPAAPTIVFVHGFPLDHTMWKGQSPLQSIASLIMLDLPGFGQSDQIDGETSMRSMADDVAHLIDLLNIPKVIYCGLSMGGYIGWEFAKEHSDRLSGLICCNTRAAADDEKTARGRRVAASQVMKTGTNPVATSMRSKLFADSTLESKPAIVQSVVDTICQTQPKTIAAAQLAMSKRADFQSQLSEINVPTLVIAGSEDVITPSAEMQEMAALIAGSDFLQIEDSGHMSPLEQPIAFNNAVTGWIANHNF